MIVLEMKCPQLSKPEATAARNENSIGDRREKKTLGETRLSRGASSPPARQISSLFQLQQSQIVSGPLVPGVFPRWMSRWRGPYWRSVSGAHLCVLDSADGQGCRGCLQVLILHLWQTSVKSVYSLMVGFLWGPPRGTSEENYLNQLTHLIQVICSLEVRSVHELCSDWHWPFTVSIAPYSLSRGNLLKFSSLRNIHSWICTCAMSL